MMSYPKKKYHITDFFLNAKKRILFSVYLRFQVLLKMLGEIK